MQEFFSLSASASGYIAGAVFLTAFLVQLAYYLGIYTKFLFYRKKNESTHPEPVSVIICARNEARNLEQHLPLILGQDYPDFEVVVVNDCSTDDTEEVLERFAAQDPRLKVTRIKRDRKFEHGKKLAVSIGIKAASHELMLFTDADCRPVSNQWIRRMTSGFTGRISIVLGYGGYMERKGMLNRYIRYDTLFIALQYFSFALCRMPYMGVGRNLAYRRSLYESGNGFCGHFHLASGDDDLFVNEHATGENTAVEIDPESHTRSIPRERWPEWVFQKKRHLSTGALYKKRDKALLVAEPFSRLLFYAGFVSLMVTWTLSGPALIAFLIRMAIHLVVIKKTMDRLQEKNLLINSLFFDIIALFINFGLIIANRIRPVSFQWK